MMNANDLSKIAGISAIIASLGMLIPIAVCTDYVELGVCVGLFGVLFIDGIRNITDLRIL
jgi:hypothetical protein